MLSRTLVAAVCAGLVCACGEGSGAESPSPDAAGFEARILPLLADHCGDCHGAESPEAELTLAQWESSAAALADRDRWAKVLKMLRSGAMPPEDAEPLVAADREMLTDWIERAVFGNDCGERPYDPGHVTIRRLNRNEYRNTIRDLVGVEFDPAADFPADDVGYGFDNIGDVLSLPPVLFEKYLAAAEKIVEQAIVPPGPPPETRRFAAKELRARPERDVDERGVLLFASNDERASTPNEIDRRGRYLLRVRAFADQAGDEPARLSVRLRRDEAATIDVTATPESPAEYEVALNVTQDGPRVTLEFVNDLFEEGQDGARQDRNVYVEWVELHGPLSPTAEELPATHRRIVFRQPHDGDNRECAKEVLARFATRAYRRPVAPEEVDRLLGLFDLAAEQSEPFERGIQYAVTAVLASPQFLFRIENDPADAAAIHQVSEYELATRLSYFLWSTMPDEELFSLAERGELRAQLDDQVRRMLADAKSAALVENFSGQWLQTRRLEAFSPDPKLFPEFDDALRQTMRRETELYFAHVMREDRSVLEFLSADYTFLNERLAKHYGIDGVTGDEFRRVELADSSRGGVMTQASVLAVTSNPTRTSPVKRGKWVMEQLLGTPPPPPPPNVPELDDQERKLVGSLRERMVQHRENALCASCHEQMDTLGFGLENFDAVGKWRDRDGEFMIDPSGTLPDGRQFQSPRELKQALLSDREGFCRCLAEKMLTYALGRGIEYDDHCAVRDIVAAVEREDYRFSALVRAIVHSDPFQYRRKTGVEP